MPSNPVLLSRTPTARGLKAGGVSPSPVDRAAKIIRGYAVCTLGEAQGHGFWIDGDMLDQIVSAGNAMPNGVKARFSHPGLCADGIGSFLGRTLNFSRDGDVVRGDLHLCDSSFVSPRGNLGLYVMDLADDSPDMFGASIVFARNSGMEAEFSKRNLNAAGMFQSPEKRNAKNLPHARLERLRGCDLVDDPAANPGGFLSARNELASVGEAALNYLFGLSEVVPPSIFGGLEPSRMKSFFQSFLQRHGLKLQHNAPAALPAAAAAPHVESYADRLKFRNAEIERKRAELEHEEHEFQLLQRPRGCVGLRAQTPDWNLLQKSQQRISALKSELAELESK